MLKLNDVTLKYGSDYGVQGITMSLELGKIYGVLGRNGSGKTSLLSMISSFRQATSGSIMLNDQALFENEALTPMISFHYTKDQSYETRKLSKLLDEAAAFYPYFDKEYALQLTKTFKLSLNKKIYKMSKGMQSAVEAVIGLASRSPITIFDEVYLGMDAPTRTKFYKELLNDHTNHPRTILISTHLVSEMDFLFEEIIMIDHGKLLLHESNDDIISKGFSLTGEAAAVDHLTQGLSVLNTDQLGPTKSAMVFGSLSDELMQEAREADIEIGSVSLQDLFIHLTDNDREEE
ncbi:ABC transporter ATP-binding protein [Bacillus horti]|uniref:ABC-2 type transport system ATP-binding protein n=1 Tax=Caldalkalibacillus horti TaxID=77523 RepID=A0ABT9VYY8_9BACI|nr:ABC transporter ATP-binding protein [Bacillus horti]MDQ0166206.1 ABC-2 type transport system ATP-binding protein [Bacillus horti]